MKEIKVSTLKKKLKKQLNNVSKAKKAIIVSRKKPKKDVVIMSIAEYKALKDKVKSASKKVSKEDAKEAIEQITNEEIQASENKDQSEVNS